MRISHTPRLSPKGGIWACELVNNTGRRRRPPLTLHNLGCLKMGAVSNGAVSARGPGLLTEMAQAVRALDCPWGDVTRLVLEVVPCR